MKLLKVTDQIITADRVTGTDTELSLQHIVTGKQGFSLDEHLQSRFDMLQKKFSFRCEEDFFCASDKKCVIQFFFKCFDRLAHGRLRNKKLTGCLRKT